MAQSGEGPQRMISLLQGCRANGGLAPRRPIDDAVHGVARTVCAADTASAVREF
jgi:hypothetical protein